MIGGIDKRVLTQNKEAIETELHTKMPLIHKGGFIPTVDHAVPPDVSLENFIYYLNRKRELIMQ
jgi:hypothetical protein